mgnify:CR=1 FL=1
MIVEFTNYYPLPGRAEDVLRHRHRGCDLRAAMGLPRGEVLWLTDGTGPAVRWLCRFESEAALADDLARRAASPEFALQRAEMGAMLERFERAIYRADP